MYPFLLTLHSWLRWIVVLVAALALARAWLGWLGKQGWTPADDRLGMFLTIALDMQVLVGLLLYAFLSPLTASAFQDLGAAMSNGAVRYWAVEHVGLMLVAVVLAHVGRALSKRAGDAVRRHRLAALFYTLAVLAVLAAIPWPFLSFGRPLVRL